MNPFTLFVVGEKYPLPCQKNDGIRPLIEGSFFTLAVFMSSLSAYEEAAMKAAPCRYGVYEHRNIPFILLDFCGVAAFDCYLNIHACPHETRERFLDVCHMNANILNIHVVDSVSGRLRILIASGAEKIFLPTVQELCRRQLEYYENAGAVDAEANTAMRRYATPDLLNRATMYGANRSM